MHTVINPKYRLCEHNLRSDNTVINQFCQQQHQFNSTVTMIQASEGHGMYGGREQSKESGGKPKRHWGMKRRGCVESTSAYIQAQIYACVLVVFFFLKKKWRAIEILTCKIWLTYRAHLTSADPRNFDLLWQMVNGNSSFNCNLSANATCANVKPLLHGQLCGAPAADISYISYNSKETGTSSIVLTQ